MPLDGIFLHFLTNELAKSITGSRVEKVHQPAKDELVLYLRSRTGTKKLFISANANSPRIHLIKNAPENPKNPTMLCMLLRKHLTSSILKAVRQIELDRVVFLDFDATNEIGDKVGLSLCVEIMAKHSDIILMKEDKTIIDAVKRIDFTKSEIRQILPGIKYELPPPQNKLNICECSVDEIMKTLENSSDKNLSSAILTNIQGVSPLISREIAELCGEDVKVSSFTEIQRNRLIKVLNNLQNSIKNLEGIPTLLKNSDEKPYDFSYMDITQYGFSLTPVEYGSYCELLDEFYRERDTINRTRQRCADIMKVLSNATSRISKKLNLQRAELSKSINREELRIKAELINANQHSLSKGSCFYDIENYYDENRLIRIAANPALSPAANSQKYYKEYRKAKNAEQILKSLIEQGEQDLQYIETVMDLLSRINSQQEIDEIRAELESEGFLKRHRKAGHKQQKPLSPIEFTSVDGFRIFVGRNNVQNDRLSLKIAGSSDMWLHTQKIPGSHVIIMAENREIPNSTIEQAAEIAAFHSNARESSLVPVDYTPAKNLKKPVGAKPGKVIYHVYNTLIVNPKEYAAEK